MTTAGRCYISLVNKLVRMCEYVYVYPGWGPVQGSSGGIPSLNGHWGRRKLNEEEKIKRGRRLNDD